jgi:uncharacterized protein (TIGR00369 family)
MGGRMVNREEVWTRELLDIMHNGNAEEREILRLTVESIQAKRLYQHSYLRTHFGFDGTYYPPDRYHLEATTHPYMMNIANYVHGGISAYIADSAMGILINTVLQPGGAAVTSNLTIHYLAPGQGEKLRAEAVLLHLGKRNAVSECRIFNDDGTVIAFVTATFSIIRPKTE